MSSLPPPLPSPPPASALPLAQSRLGTLSTLFWIWGGLQLLVIGFIGLVALVGYQAEAANDFSDPNARFAFALLGLAGGFSLLLMTLNVLAAISLRQARRPLLCQVAAGLACLSIPFGTALGIFTLITLQRPEVRALFQGDGVRA